jgi:hypothetical protein
MIIQKIKIILHFYTRILKILMHVPDLEQGYRSPG